MPSPTRPTVTVGADPELFVRNTTTGKIVSVHDLLPGTKAEPFKLPHGFGAVQVDGVAAEFNTHPAGDYADFENAIDQTMSSLEGMLRKKGPYELVYEPFHVFDKEYFDNLPLVTKTLGCTPDWNAYTVSYNPPPDRGTTPTLCTASGHVHAGWGAFDPEDPDHITDCALVAKELDYSIGLPSMLWDPSAERRMLYGKAGAFRPKPYGLEYRVLSNKWLDPKLRYYNREKMDPLRSRFHPNVSLSQWVCQQVQWTLQRIFAGELFTNYLGDSLAREIIDGNITDWVHNPKYSKILKFIPLPPVPMPPKPEEKPKKDPSHFKTQKGRKLEEAAMMYGLSNANIVNPPVFIHDDPEPSPPPENNPQPAPAVPDPVSSWQVIHDLLHPNEVDF